MALLAKTSLTKRVKTQIQCFAEGNQHHPLREILVPISDSVKMCDLVGTIWAHFASPAPLVSTFTGSPQSPVLQALLCITEGTSAVPRALIELQVFPLPQFSLTTAEEREMSPWFDTASNKVRWNRCYQYRVP